MQSLIDKARQYVVLDYNRSLGNVETGMCLRLRADTLQEAVILLREHQAHWPKEMWATAAGRSWYILEEQTDGTYISHGALIDMEAQQDAAPTK
jgi:hypothetical protein